VVVILDGFLQIGIDDIDGMMVPGNKRLDIIFAFDTMQLVPEESEEEVKYQGQSYPENGPQQCLPERKRMTFPVNKSQVYAEHQDDHQKEAGKGYYFMCSSEHNRIINFI
jgi:YHS domain-containing protein